MPGFLFFIVCAVLAWRVSNTNSAPIIKSQNSLTQVCHFVKDRIYLDDKKLRHWFEGCVKMASTLKPDASVPSVIESFNNSFSELHTSHLTLYSPSEASKVWEGQSKETGLEAMYVDGELMVSKVHSRSPAFQKGLRSGDVILKINDGAGDPTEAESTSGSYVIERNGKKQIVLLEVSEFQRDESLDIKELSPEIAWLRVPSFRAEFFEEKAWKPKVQELKKYKKLMVDLRGNLGGNFVAGLRFLSPFLCQPTEIGSLIKPKSRVSHEETLPNDLQDDAQLEVVDRSQRTRLQTFPTKVCITASLVVLVDSGSASTSELVAEALKEKRSAQISGTSSAGQMLVGVWYPMPEVGEGVRISIPEAIYESTGGQQIEGPGVKVDRTLYYHLEDFRRGHDSWIDAVSK